MRIQDNFAPTSDPRSNQVQSPREVAAPGLERGGRSEKSSDTVGLSALGARLTRALSNEPPELVAKIEQLEKAVTNGTFSAPPGEVASAVIDAALAEGAGLELRDELGSGEAEADGA